MPFTILAQAEEKLQYEKHEWLQSHILHRELQEIILDYELQAHDTALSTADKEIIGLDFLNPSAGKKKE